jgi:hypothetical protein
VVFQSSVSVSAVCPFCQSLVVRHDLNVETMGKVAQLPPDLSQLQIGARGEYNGQSFTIIGRIRVVYEEGSWNEWFARFGNEVSGWVAEAQGVFMVSLESPAPTGFADRSRLTIGSSIELEHRPYRVIDRKEVQCAAAEGELNFVATPGRTAFSVDLVSTGGRFASVEYAETGTSLFIGRYATFDELKFSNLRSVPGWSDDLVEPTRNQTSALKCPKCGGVITLRAPGLAMSATCGSCGSLVDTATPDLQLLHKATERQRITPILPIGKRGKLFEVLYEVIGFQHVKDNYSGWQEYLLFNPWQGFVWLVTYQGHWSFVRRLFDEPATTDSNTQPAPSTARIGDETFRLFAFSRVSTDYVLGEFYWKVNLQMVTQATDFVNGARILSRETYPNLDEETWSLGEYVDRHLIEQAFGLSEPLREPVGVYLNQPNPYREKAKQLSFIVPAILLFLLCVQMISASQAARHDVLKQSFVYHAGTTNSAVVSQPFEIIGGNRAVEITFEAPVENNWLEVSAELVKADTQQSVESFIEEISYYHGYDDGEWKEGGPKREHLIPGLAPGIYRLILETSADPGIHEMPLTVTARAGVIVWSNFWIGLILILAYPVYCWLRSWSFESARWSESDYSQFGTLKTHDD